MVQLSEEKFSELTDKDIALDFAKAKSKYTEATKNIHRKKKCSKLSDSVTDLQERYDLIASNENATPEDWQEFYLSIEKLIMKQASFNNYKKFIPKDSELWCDIVSSIMDQIIPKRNLDGTRSCWFIDRETNRICKGYNPKKANIGSFIINRTKWLVLTYNKKRTDENIVDMDITNLSDDFEYPEIQKVLDNKEQIKVVGNTTEYNKKLESILKFHSFVMV